MAGLGTRTAVRIDVVILVRSLCNSLALGRARRTGYSLRWLSRWGITDEVMSGNEFNEEPGDCNTYSFAELEVTYVGRDSEDPAVELDVAYVVEDGNTTHAYDVDAVNPQLDLYEIGELYEDGSDTAMVLLEIPEEDEDELLRITPGFISDDVFVLITLNHR